MYNRDVEDGNGKAGNRENPRGQNPAGNISGASSDTTMKECTNPQEQRIMEAVLEHTNIEAALKRVIGNKGAPGIDGMTVGELKSYISNHWHRIAAELMEGRYKPTPVRAVEIAKSGGGMRKLGIPTVVDLS